MFTIARILPAGRRQSRIGLRSTVTVAVALIAGLGVGLSILLVHLTSIILHAGDHRVAAIHSLGWIQEIEVDLLLHARATDRAVRAAHEAEILGRLATATEHLTSPAEEQAHARALDDINAYLAASRAGPSTNGVANAALGSAFSSLEALLEINVRQADDAAVRAARANRLANVSGFACLSIFGGLVASLIWWLWRRSLHPVLELSQVMSRFGAGDRSARARATGAAELRTMATAFNAMADEIGRQREAQMTFLAGIAHDLRNPLGPLRAAAAVLSSGERRGMRSDQTILRVLERQVTHLDRLIGDLLDLGRIEAGRLDLRLEDVDARVIAEEAVELYRPSAPNVSFHLDTPPGPVPLHCDSTRVHQVLNNLISNAVKYSGGTGDVAIAVESDRHHVTFSVRDRGSGIAASELTRLFEPFQRVHDEEVSPVPGQGLGLFLARRIVEAHAGTLRVRSVEGEGSTFRVELPLASCVPTSL